MRTLHAILPAAVFGCLLAAPAALAAAPGDGETTKLNLDDTATSTAQGGGPGGGSIVRTIFGLAVVLGVIYGLHWLLKRVKASKDATASGEALETIATLPLGTNRALHLVRTGREIVLLGTAEHTVAPIRRYSEQEARALGLIDTPATFTVGFAVPDELPPVESAEPKGFLDILRSKTVVK
jgi:flagellar protein FliO/FliZ